MPNWIELPVNPQTIIVIILIVMIMTIIIIILIVMIMTIVIIIIVNCHYHHDDNPQVNPPNARKIQIHNLAAGTTYEFQVR